MFSADIFVAAMCLRYPSVALSTIHNLSFLSFCVSFLCRFSADIFVVAMCLRYPSVALSNICNLSFLSFGVRFLCR